MSEEKQLPVVFNDAQRNIILMQTPPGEIEWRKGPRGQMVPYVKIGYVVETLNLGLGFNWDFEITHQEYLRDLDEVLVLGRLTARANGQAISKMQFGSAKVKRYEKNNEIIALADDYKAAASDALKKCASLLGVAHDVYRGQVEAVNTETGELKPTRAPAKRTRKAASSPKPKKHWIDNDEARRRFWAWAEGTLKRTEEQVYEALSVEHLHDFTGTMKEAKAILEASAMDIPTE